MNVQTDPPMWREFPSGLLPPADAPIRCVKCDRPAQLYVLDVREDMWFTCLVHHVHVLLDLLNGKLDDQHPPERIAAGQLSADPSDQDARDTVQAWREVLAFRAQLARLRALTDQLRFAIYVLDETSAPLREVIDAEAALAETGDREVRDLPENFEAAARSARAVERIILDFVRGLSPEPPSGLPDVQ